MKTQKEKCPYEERANSFLSKHNVKIEISFLRHDKYFHDDKESRDVYSVKIFRDKRYYGFEFGQSIVNSGFYYTKGKQKIAIERKFLDVKNLAAIIKKRDWYFLNNGKSDIIHYPEKPSNYDILACITKRDPGTFEEFCIEFGYSNDSIKAEKTYKAVVNEYTNMCRIFSDSELEELQEIQ